MDDNDLSGSLGSALILNPGPDSTSAASYDAIVLDAMMPGLDGYETCRRLKAAPETAGIPVVFLTAKTQRGEVERALALGAVACLMKPFDPMTLARELRTALGR